MKLIVLSNKCSGLLAFRKELIRKLTENHEVLICTPDDDRADEFREMRCRFLKVGFSRRGMNPLADLKLYSRYKKLLRAEKPDVVLTYTVKPNIYGGLACRRSKIPYIANVTGLGTALENGGLLSGITFFLYKIGLKKARCVMFQNENNKTLFENRNIVGGNARLIPGSGVNLDEHCFEEYPSEEDGIRLIFVGRIMRDKGVGELLSAVEKVHERSPDVSLDIVGRYEEDYQDRIEGLTGKGLVRYHGTQNDVHPFYKNAHCAVMPSYHEGMSNVLLEASATGRPVIATNVPGCRETFDEGVTGLGCEPKSAEDLADAIEKFLALDRSDRERMGAAAREKMVREFDRNIVIEAYMEEINGLNSTPDDILT